jgi:hypothetical protein
LLTPPGIFGWALGQGVPPLVALGVPGGRFGLSGRALLTAFGLGECPGRRFGLLVLLAQRLPSRLFLRPALAHLLPFLPQLGFGAAELAHFSRRPGRAVGLGRRFSGGGSGRSGDESLHRCRIIQRRVFKNAPGILGGGFVWGAFDD